MAVVSMYHRGIDALLKDMRQHPEDAKVRTSSDLNPKPQTVNRDCRRAVRRAQMLAICGCNRCFFFSESETFN